MKLNYKTYGDLLLDIKQNLHKVPNNIDLVVGIPRSGMIPAYMLGLSLNISVCSLDEFVSEIHQSHSVRQIKQAINYSNVLVVDDSVNIGGAMRKAKKIIGKTFANKDIKIYYSAIYVQPGYENHVDISFVLLAMPRMFQWNYLNHGLIQKSCFDIDGVLCYDPTEDENDDGEKYRHFLLNAKPLHIPQYKIKALVTSRLEKYRAETETWLEQHNVKYDALYMLDMASKEERIKCKGIHARFKAAIYLKLKKCSLFYESNKQQAEEIASITGKTVFCVDTDELINNREVAVNSFISKKSYMAKIFFSRMPYRLFHSIVPKKWQVIIKQKLKNNSL
jgi:uncharacterized HAD superfamily protein/hypoxanthine phosphoribosyltransferase